jgi:subtilase family serine protease
VRKFGHSAVNACTEVATTRPLALGLRPQDLHSAYELSRSAPTEQTIAVVDADNDPNIEADLDVYDEAFDLPACTHANGCFTKMNQEGASSPLPAAEGGWVVETSLDVEIAHAVCQSCHRSASKRCRRVT